MFHDFDRFEVFDRFDVFLRLDFFFILLVFFFLILLLFFYIFAHYFTVSIGELSFNANLFRQSEYRFRNLLFENKVSFFISARAWAKTLVFFFKWVVQLRNSNSFFSRGEFVSFFSKSWYYSKFLFLKESDNFCSSLSYCVSCLHPLFKTFVQTPTFFSRLDNFS